MTSLGFIGLGAMGAPMARRLLAGGHTVTVWARRRESMQPLVDAGALPGSSPAHVASSSDIVHTMVIDTDAVESVILGGDGVVQTARPGSVVIDHSTISPARSTRIAETLRSRGIEMLDAPVSGGVQAASAGTLAMMVGGDEPTFDRCRPILAALAERIVYVGRSGSGQLTKACNQIALIINQLGAAEAMLVAERGGLDPVRVKEAMMGGFAASRILDVQAPKMIDRDFTGKIESRLHHKDILIALELARELGLQLPASALAAEMLGLLQQRGGAREDSAAVFTVLESLSAKP